MELSVIIPVYNEEGNVKPLLIGISKSLSGLSYELIIVDDGSTDHTVSQIKALANQNTKLILLSRNYGQTAAMAAGIDAAQGDYVVTMDGDLQNDPSDIPVMLAKLKMEGWDVIAGNRKHRQDRLLLRKIPSNLANRLIRWMTGVQIHDYGCTLKIFRKQIAKNLGLYGELHRFIPVLTIMEGGKITEMEVQHHPRIHGESKYGLGRTVRVISDLLLMVFFLKYFRRPIHFFGPIGILSLMMGSAICVHLLIVKIMGQDIWGRPILILSITLVLAGIQFLTFGIIAELIVRTYYESQKKKTYNVREVFVAGNDGMEILKHTVPFSLSEAEP